MALWIQGLGTEPRVVRVNGVYYDDHHMIRSMLSYDGIKHSHCSRSLSDLRLTARFLPFSPEASLLLASGEPPSFVFAALHQKKIIKNRLEVLKSDRLRAESKEAQGCPLFMKSA